MLGPCHSDLDEDVVVAVPHASTIGLNPGYNGGHILGAQHNPFQPGGDPNGPNFGVQNLLEQARPIGTLPATDSSSGSGIGTGYMLALTLASVGP